MSTTRRPFADILAAVAGGKLSVSELVNELNSRGAVPAAVHKTELKMLDDALAQGRVDERMHRLLSAKLKDLQVSKPAAPARPSPAAGDADRTVMGGGDATRLNPDSAASADATRINPAAAGDSTVINPEAGNGNGGFDLLIEQSGEDADKTQMGGPGGESTAFTPQDGGPHTGSRTGTGSGGPSTSSWQRVATQGGPEREVHAGDTLKDRFYLDKEVGRGGMGIVFKARDERKVEAQDKNPWVAVKVLNPEFRKHPQALVALQRESRKAQQLTHDNILRVYDFDKDGSVIYMTMEYCDAGALKDWIRKHPQGMPWDKGWPIIAGLARGLGRAHRDNIVHSDFKPGNVMMTAEGTPKLFDMGIARAAKSGADAKGETTVFDAGELGALTPAYASLEMIQGQPPELIDDIYALGITAYEILTGKHPFGKKNAEQAMKEGLKPPVVPGLTRKQRATLERSIAFKRADRMSSCEAFLEGLRPRTMREQLLPIGIALSLAALLTVVVFGPGRNYLRERRVDALVARYQASDFTAVDQAALAFINLDEKEKALARQQSPAIQKFFFDVANSKWDVAAKRFDYTAAFTALKAAESLFPDSASVAQNLERVADEQKSLLSNLNDEFNGHVEAGRIYETAESNVVQTVALVRQVDPQSDILKDAKLSGRYTTDIRNALEAGNFELAAARAATALKVFPNDKALAALQSNVTQGREMQLAAAREREMRDKMSAEDAKKALIQLAANPLFTPDWQVNVKVAMSKLGADASPETTQAKAQLAEAYGRQLTEKLDAKDLMGAQVLADAGMRMFPGVPNLTREATRLAEARKAQQAEEAAKAAVAEAETLKRTVRAKADANDVRAAQAAIDKLRAIQPADPFILGDGAKALGSAYLRQANKQAEQGRFDTAMRFVSEGLKASPGMQELKDAEVKYGAEAEAAKQKAAAEAASKPATETASAAPSPSSPSSLPQEARKERKPRAAPGVDTCLTSYATYGTKTKATCQDDAGGTPGPKLVVIPGPAGGYLAVSKYEIRNAEFNAFCAATGKCSAGGSEAMPRTGISLSLARAYASWLSDVTGFNYRLPTDAEWAHAANAGGAGPGEDFQCVVLAGGSQIKGGAPISVTTGKPNAWGLLNAVGNVAEWTEGGNVRGGHYNTPTSQCSVEWKQGGSEGGTVGMRLVREMG